MQAVVPVPDGAYPGGKYGRRKTPFLVSRAAHTTRQLAGFPFRASPTASSIQGWAPGRWLLTRQTTTPPLAPERFETTRPEIPIRPPGYLRFLATPQVPPIQPS